MGNLSHGLVLEILVDKTGFIARLAVFANAGTLPAGLVSTNEEVLGFGQSSFTSCI
jgi:hypothetical protein